MSFMRLMTNDTAEVPVMVPRVENGVPGGHRRVVMTTCQAHGASGFTNLLVTKENGIIVLNPLVGKLLRDTA